MTDGQRGRWIENHLLIEQLHEQEEGLGFKYQRGHQGAEAPFSNAGGMVRRPKSQILCILGQNHPARHELLVCLAAT